LGSSPAHDATTARGMSTRASLKDANNVNKHDVHDKQSAPRSNHHLSRQQQGVRGNTAATSIAPNGHVKSEQSCPV
jgi:hypothetical protein